MEFVILAQGGDGRGMTYGSITKLFVLRQESIVEHAEPIVLGLEPIELGAVLFASVDLISLELMKRHAKPPGFDPGRFPLGHEPVLGRERVREIRIAVVDERREPIDLGPSGQQVGLPSPLALSGLRSVTCLLGAPGFEFLLELCHLAPKSIGLAPKRLDFAPQSLEVARQCSPLLYQRPNLARRETHKLAPDRFRFG
jgi:hypothetical protein